MAGYLPPVEDLPIFDEGVFRAGDEALTYNTALKYFLRYPNAQGKEFLQEIEVEGTSIFNENLVINNNSSITSTTPGFITTITPSLISTDDTNAGTNAVINSTSVTFDSTGVSCSVSSDNGDLKLTADDTKNIIMEMNNVSKLTITDTQLLSGVAEPPLGDDSQNLATTAFVKSAIDAGIPNINVTNTTSNTEYALPLITGTATGSYPPYAGGTMTYNPSTNILTVPSIIATATQPAPSSNGTAVPTTAWVTSKLANFIASPNTWSGSQTFNATQILGNGNILQFVSGTSTYNIAPTNNPQPCLRYNMTAGTAPGTVLFANMQTPSSSANTASGLMIGQNGTGSSCIQNYANAGATPGFTFTSVTDTLASKVVGIIPYNQPLVSDDGQNLATTAWVKSVISAGSILATNNVWSGTNTFNNSVSSNIVKTNPNGIIQVIASDGVTNSQFSQVGIDLTLATPTGGEFKITSQGGGVLPTATNIAGMSVLWNVSSGLGESCLVNYQDGGGGAGAGGFDFYNVTASTNSVKIASIPVTQPPTSEDSTKLATTAWVKSVLTASSLLGSTNVWTAQNTFNNFCPISNISPTVNGSLVNLNYLNTQINNLKKTIPLKAVENFGPLTGDYINTLSITAWAADYAINDFITLRYTLSNNYPYTSINVASINTATSTGYIDIYPFRMGLAVAPIGTVTNYNVLNNTINGTNAYNMNSTLTYGRWFWAYNQTNINAPANGFYLYIKNVTGTVLDIGLYISSPSVGNQYNTSFVIELVSSKNNSQIVTSDFNISNF